MIGLKRGTVQLVSYQPVWKRLFEEEAARLHLALGSRCLQIEHIGSTAIEGMDAKPIIDILVAVDGFKTANELVPALMKLGYTHKDDDDMPERVFFTKGPPSRRTHHLSLTEPSTAYWKWHVLFRDCLQGHPEVAEQYKQLKIRLAEQYPNDRGSYTSAKKEFIEHVVSVAELGAQNLTAQPAGSFRLNTRGTMKIRQALLEDSAGIARVQVDSYRTAYAGLFPAAYLEHFTYEEQEQDWRELLSAADKDVLYVAVTSQGEVVGYGLGRRNADKVLPYESELVALHVRRDYQRQGVGRWLLAAVGTELATQGCNSLFLWVLADNPARSFYERLGGQFVGEKAWQNNEYFGTDIYEVAYGWPDIRTLLVGGPAT